MYRSQRPSSFLKQTWPIGLVHWCFPMPARPCKKLCFVKKELDQFNMQNMHKILSKIKANTGINLGDNAIVIQWQYSKPNNRNS